MTSVLDGRAGQDSVEESPLLNPAAARREFEDLVEWLAERLVAAASKSEGGLELGVGATTFAALEVAERASADLTRWQDALSEAVLELLSRKRLALTADQRLVALAAPQVARKPKRAPKEPQ